MVYNYFFLFYFLCSFLTSFSSQYTNALRLAFIINNQEKRPSLSEGFDGKTLVKTSDGYAIIKDLKIGDYVVNEQNEPKKIVSTGQRLVTQWIEFDIDHEHLCTACDQLFYIPQQQDFITANNLFRSNSIFNTTNNVNNVQKINGLKVLYCLTVEDQVFCVTHRDILAHNSNALIASSFCLGHITVINPVIAIIGATMSLAKIGYDLYKDTSATIEIETNQKSTFQSRKTISEHDYYKKRRNELLILKNDFIQIKNELRQLKGLISPSFTYEFLYTDPSVTANQDPYLKLSLEKELSLSLQEKSKLRQDRNAELASIEQEILAIQLTLALHFNELIEQRNMLSESYSNVASKDYQIFHIQNNQPIIHCTISNKNALEIYKYILLEDHLLNAIINKNNEIQLIANYYTTNTKTDLLKKCSSIFDVIDQEKNWWKDNQIWITQAKKTNYQNIIATEKYLRDQNFSAKEITLHIKKALDKTQKGINKKAFIQASDKLLVVQNSFNQEAREEADDNKLTGAQAPGKPTEKHGYVPPKNWDGEKVRSPHGQGYGWPDENGRIWIPTGPKGHGGPHWDVQSRDGKTYDNVYPSGKIRTGRK